MIAMSGLLELIMDIEALLEEEDYSYFENVIINNLKDINKLNDLMKKVADRLKANVPEWVR